MIASKTCLDVSLAIKKQIIFNWNHGEKNLN